MAENKTEKNEKTIDSKEAIARGRNIRISTKHAIAICNFIKGKKIMDAIEELEKVIKMKMAIPMKGEIPHRKEGFQGRYPVKAAKVFIKLLKSLKANADAKGIDLENAKIFAKADKASRPQRPGKYIGRRFKGTHLFVSIK
ncbi:MAG: 50S ribosomal protein L22 [Candidatus Pacearchaeota archaeon]